MKKYIVTALAVMTGFISSAQIQRTVVKQKPDSVSSVPAPVQKNDSGKEIFKELDLTKEQRGKLREINQSMKASKEALESDTTMNDESRKEKLKALRKEHRSKIQAILTEEQKIKFRQLKAKSNDNG